MVTFTAIVLWDCMSLFPRECRTMWKRNQRWTLLRALFFLNRYFPVFTLVFGCAYLAGTIPVGVCRRSWPVLLFTWEFVTAVSDAILAIRVYAMYNRSRIVLVIMVALYVSEIALLIRANFDIRRFELTPEAAASIGLLGCAAAAKPSKRVSAALYGYAPSLAFNCIILGMTLWQSVSTRIRYGKLRLLQQMQNDGIYYFVVVVTVNTIALGFAAQRRPSLQIAALPASVAIISISCNRLILSLRCDREPVEPSVKLATIPWQTR
ncbi:hypothetical protein JCM11491_002535 [Sporobolomyces phaffii]